MFLFICRLLNQQIVRQAQMLQDISANKIEKRIFPAFDQDNEIRLDANYQAYAVIT